MAYADPAPRAQPQAIQQNGAIKPVAAHTGWIIQVGALESESEARQRIEAARNQAHGLLSKADPFTEPVVAKGDRKLFRARFAGLERDQAEAVCRTLKRSDISCITVRELIGSSDREAGVKPDHDDPCCRHVDCHAKIRGCKPLVKILRLKLCEMNDRPRRTTAGGNGASDRRKTEATRGL